MGSRHRKQLGISWKMFFFLVLGLAVSLWGLQYKLSLYAPPESNAHLVPAAKLLLKEANNEVDQNTSHDREPEPMPRIPFIAGFALLALAANRVSLLAIWRRYYRNLRLIWGVCGNSYPSPFFFRPPPAVL